jgi:hypothetical protein
VSFKTFILFLIFSLFLYSSFDPFSPSACSPWMSLATHLAVPMWHRCGRKEIQRARSIEKNANHNWQTILKRTQSRRRNVCYSLCRDSTVYWKENSHQEDKDIARTAERRPGSFCYQRSKTVFSLHRSRFFRSYTIRMS